MTALLDAATARMTAAGAPRVYSLGSVPLTPAYPYAVLSATTGDPIDYRLSAEHGAKRWRVKVQSFGKTIGEVTRTLERAEAAFLDQTLTEVDAGATPCSQDLATDPDRDPDAAGVVYALVVYTFTARSN